MIIYVLLAAALVLALLWWGTSTFSSLSGIPGPRPLPIVGNLHEMLGTSQHEAQGLLMRKYGGVVRFFMGRRGLVLVSDPELVHEVTVTAAEHFRNRPMAMGRARNSLGLLQARDDYWKRLRRTISPTFNVMHLKHMLPPMHEEVQVLMAKLEEACDAKQEVDIHAMFTRLTLDIIGRVAFGTKLNAQTSDDNTLIGAAGWLFRNIPRNNGLLALLFPSLWEFKQKLWPSAFRKQVMKAQDVLDEVSLSLIRKRKQERDAEELTSDKCASTERIPNDFLDLLFDARDKTTGQALTEEEIRDQANTFLLAGHETTANTLAYTVFLVSQHPEVDEKLFEELSDQLADEGAPLDLNQLSAMTHLNMALKESLRMYPPATSTAREADTDVTIGDKFFIPKGSPVVIPIKAMGNNPDLWPEPERFLPFDRWAGDEKGDGEKKHSLVWLPFGAGPRNCIGQRFAIIEAKLVLAHVLRRFRLQLSPGQVPLELDPGITTSPKHGIRVTLHRR